MASAGFAVASAGFAVASAGSAVASAGSVRRSGGSFMRRATRAKAQIRKVSSERGRDDPTFLGSLRKRVAHAVSDSEAT